jgi:ankyrin repeat protein
MFSGSDEIVEMLLEHGAKCGIVEAAALGKLDIIKKLLSEDPTLIEKRSNFGFSGKGGTPLYWAVSRGRTNVVEYLLKNKADANARHDDASFNRTPLLLAIGRANMDMVKLLLANGADAKAADSIGWTGLHYIANAGPKYGIVPKDPKPLDWTASQSQLDIAQLLLDHGADINAKDGLNRTPLRAALNPSGAVQNFADFLRKRGGKEDWPKPGL